MKRYHFALMDTKKFLLAELMPIVDENSTILILGTMPGEKSLALNQY